MIEEVTVDLLKEKINDTRYPFGHGYRGGRGARGHCARGVYCM